MLDAFMRGSVGWEEGVGVQGVAQILSYLSWTYLVCVISFVWIDALQDCR